MLSPSLSKSLLEGIFGIKSTVSFPGVAYLGISTTDPGADGTSFSEPSPSTGYSRCLIGKVNNKEATYMEVSELETEHNRIIRNNRMILMDMLTTDVGANGTHYLLFSEEDGGVPYAWGQLKDAITLAADRVVVFKEGNLELELTDAQATASAASE